MSELIRDASQVLLSSEDQVTDGSSQGDNGALKRAIGKEERSHNRLHENNIVGRREEEEGEDEDEDEEAGSETQPLLPSPTAAGDRHMPLQQDENSRNSDSESGTKGNNETDADDKSTDCEDDAGTALKDLTKLAFPLPPEESYSTAEDEEELRQLMRDSRRERLCGLGSPRSAGGFSVMQSSWRYIMFLLIAFMWKAILRERTNEEKKGR